MTCALVPLITVNIDVSDECNRGCKISLGSHRDGNYPQFEPPCAIVLHFSSMRLRSLFGYEFQILPAATLKNTSAEMNKNTRYDHIKKLTYGHKYKLAC